MEKVFVLSQDARKNILKCFSDLWGKNSLDYELVKLMSDYQLCQYWSHWFDSPISK